MKVFNENGRLLPLAALMFLVGLWAVWGHGVYAGITFTSNTPAGTTGFTTNAQGQVTSTFTTNCQNCAIGGDPSQGGGGSSLSKDSPPPPPPPPPCFLTLATPVVASGTKEMNLSWTPAPFGKVSLRRAAAKIVVPDNATSFVDDVSKLKKGTYYYSLSYQKAVTLTKVVKTKGIKGVSLPTVSTTTSIVGGDTHVCSASFKVVEKLTECNDGIDNADKEDALIDQNDPACHSDGDPSDGDKTYVATTTSETNSATNLRSEVFTGRSYSISETSFTLGDRIYMRGTTTNTTDIYAPASNRAIGYRLVGGGDAECVNNRTVSSGWFGGKNTQCVSYGGSTYIRATRGIEAFAPRVARHHMSSWTPNVSGSYEVCMLSDIKNEVIESSEADNVQCRTATVSPGVDVDVKVRPVGGTTWSDSLSAEPGTEVELQWVPDDSVTSCRSMNTALFRLPASPAENSVAGVTAILEEPSIGAQTYIVECRNASGQRGTDFATLRVSQVSGPVSLTANPARVRTGNTSTLTWDTGGRAQCTLTATNGDAIPLSSAGGPLLSGTQESLPVTRSAVYTLSCTDPGFEDSARANVNILPVYREI